MTLWDRGGGNAGPAFPGIGFQREAKVKQGVLFWKKEPKNFCQFGEALDEQRDAAFRQGLFASFASAKEEFFPFF